MTTLRRVWAVALLASCGRFGFDAVGDGGGGSGDAPRDAAPPSCFRGVAAGKVFSCAIDQPGTVWCWGHNIERESNPSSNAPYSPTPSAIPLPAPAVEVEAGSQFACARLEDGRVWCWGDNGDGNLGNSTTTGHGPSEVVLGNERAAELATGARNACIIRASDGGVMCWGSRADGMLAANSSVPVEMTVPTGAHGLVMSHRHACVLDATNQMVCWGRRRNGELGPPLTDQPTPMPVTTFGAQAAVADGGGKILCALDNAGGVHCAGDGSYGALGDGSFHYSATPTSVAMSGAIDIGAGAKAACARRGDGSVACWGSGATGMLGDLTFDARAIPANVVLGPRSVSAMAVGYHHVCGLTEDHVVCWGRDTEAQLGRGERAVRTTPHLWNSPGTPQTSLSMGSSHACQVRAGVAQCWGLNHDGQLGDGTRTSRRAAVDVVMPFTPLGIAAGGSTTCAFSATNVACWGEGSSGQIGDGMTHSDPLLLPKQIALGGVVQLAVGQFHVCAITGGMLECWGSNSYGQLGLGAAVTERTSPTVVPVVNPMRVAAGVSHTCVIEDGAPPVVKCWGQNVHGQLGDTTKTDSSAPGAAVALPSTPVEIAMGREHTCAIVMGGQVYCWGRNDGDQVGVADQSDHPSPVLVNLPAAATSIGANYNATCATLSDGRVACWGVGGFGELGNGVTIASSLPVIASGLSTAKLVRRSINSVCAALSDGDLACWGTAETGILGDNVRDDVATPMEVPLACAP